MLTDFSLTRSKSVWDAFKRQNCRNYSYFEHIFVWYGFSALRAHLRFGVHGGVVGLEGVLGTTDEVATLLLAGERLLLACVVLKAIMCLQGEFTASRKSGNEQSIETRYKQNLLHGRALA